MRLGLPMALPMFRETRERFEGVKRTELVPLSKKLSSEGALETCLDFFPDLSLLKMKGRGKGEEGAERNESFFERLREVEAEVETVFERSGVCLRWWARRRIKIVRQRVKAMEARIARTMAAITGVEILGFEEGEVGAGSLRGRIVVGFEAG